jgi:hypothetical protein
MNGAQHHEPLGRSALSAVSGTAGMGIATFGASKVTCNFSFGFWDRAAWTEALAVCRARSTCAAARAATAYRSATYTSMT